MSRVYVVRHGNTFAPNEPPRRVGARTDLPLTAGGRAQARALREWFDAASVRFGRVRSSPLARARQTAAALADGPIETAAWLAEIDHGPDENRLETEVIARVGAAALASWDRHGIAPPEWRVDASARLARWRAFFDDARASDSTQLVVTSSGAARLALLAMPELEAAAAALPSRKLRTAAWSRFDFGDGQWRITEWDRRPEQPRCLHRHASGA